jgi:hypothetical protein
MNRDQEVGLRCFQRLIDGLEGDFMDVGAMLPGT